MKTYNIYVSRDRARLEFADSVTAQTGEEACWQAIITLGFVISSTPKRAFLTAKQILNRLGFFIA